MIKRKAFTLIELLIVVAIIAILAVIIVLNLVSAREKANYAKVKDELQTMSTAARIAYTDGTVIQQQTWAGLAAQPDLDKMKDSAGNALVTTVPIAPAGFGTASSPGYRYYLNSSSDFGFRIADKVTTSSWCANLNGSFFVGSKRVGGDGAAQTYLTCNP